MIDGHVRDREIRSCDAFGSHGARLLGLAVWDTNRRAPDTFSDRPLLSLALCLSLDFVSHRCLTVA
jgi:hypothetical protein